MARLSKGIPYFDINTDLNDDKRIKLLRAEFGIKGFGIWIELIRQIYADEGYFMVWDRDTKLLFASDVGESGGLVEEVVNGSVKRGLFNKAVFDQFNVLTSKHIQEKYFNAIKRRTSITEVDARYLVIPVDDNIIKGNVYIKLLNVNISAQSRVDESKVNTPNNARAREGGPDHKPKSIEEVITFFQQNGAAREQALDFFDHYEMQGWVRRNGMAITSWHSAASAWIRRERHDPPVWKNKQSKHGGKYATDRKSKGDQHVEALRGILS